MSKGKLRGLIGLGALGAAALASDVHAQQTAAGAPPPGTATGAAPTAAPQVPAGTAAQAGSGAPLQLQVAPTPSADASGTADDGTTGDGSDGAVRSSVADTGFETSLRLGIGVPVGSAGQDSAGTDRSVSDLTPWRVPIWIDVGYHFSPATTLGVYAQVGIGGTGDACTSECDWSDLRIGVEGQWRVAPASPLNPWLGLGLGYESLSYRTLQLIEVVRPDTGTPTQVSTRIAERLGGPELLLQAGLDFEVEDSLHIGPYLSATGGLYLSDSFTCDVRGACPLAGLDGSGLHGWLGVGVRGSYFP